ncbi:MAG: DUF3822 family protein [Tannerellaceae bacterium]|nr:DUF3822 family protein [Tannerellaceae bacterium]
MVISLPDTYTSDNSEKNILSIRLNPDGLSFSIYNPSVSESYLYKEISLDKRTAYTEALKECFFENSFFTWPFLRTHIIETTPLYTLLPSSLVQEKTQERFLSYNFEQETGHVLVNKPDIPDATLLFNVQEEVYEFCSRSFIHPAYYHHLTPLLGLWRTQSSSHAQACMYVFIHPGFIDVACYRNGNLNTVNSFTYQQPQDILYYILYIWQQKEMDQLNDLLFVTGTTEFFPSLIKNLQIYLNNVQPAEIPSEAYLKGGDILKAPLDLITLSL